MSVTTELMGLISILLLSSDRYALLGWRGKWGKRTEREGRMGGVGMGILPVISSGKMESRTSRSSICSS